MNSLVLYEIKNPNKQTNFQKCSKWNYDSQFFVLNTLLRFLVKACGAENNHANENQFNLPGVAKADNIEYAHC